MPDRHDLSVKSPTREQTITILLPTNSSTAYVGADATVKGGGLNISATQNEDVLTIAANCRGKWLFADGPVRPAHRVLGVKPIGKRQDSL